MKSQFDITNKEYLALEKEYGKLAYTQAWQLLKKNTKNNHTNEFEDILQEIKMHLLIAGCSHKRQTYIKKGIDSCLENIKDDFLLSMAKELESLWENRKKHGANSQKFGVLQEAILDKLLETIPDDKKPHKTDELIIDERFARYCKAITWNCQKNLGKKISKERSLRNGICSISEFDYLASDLIGTRM